MSDQRFPSKSLPIGETYLSQLVKDNSLHPFGLAIEPTTHLICCISCACYLTPTAIADHFRHKHSDSGAYPSSTIIEKATKKHNLANAIPELWKSNTPISRLPGLPVMDRCVRCTLCTSVYADSSIRTHITKKHPGSTVIALGSLPAIHGQKLSQGRNNKIFEVFPCSLPHGALAKTTPALYLESLRDIRNKEILEYNPATVDPRAVSPWLLSTGWHLHLQGSDPQALRAYTIAPKNEGYLDFLQAGVIAFVERAAALIEHTPELVLQSLNTPDLSK
jgi:hypothetical protein